VRTVAIADVVMSLDNVLAIAAAAHGDMTLIVFGLAISIPLIVAGATLIMALLTRFPILVWAGAGLLGWIAGELMVEDPVSGPYFESIAAAYGLSHKALLLGMHVLCTALGAGDRVVPDATAQPGRGRRARSRRRPGRIGALSAQASREYEKGLGPMARALLSFSNLSNNAEPVEGRTSASDGAVLPQAQHWAGGWLKNPATPRAVPSAAAPGTSARTS
jgi:hypothetical protein